jgi:tetratricopeptide (TPR) repeat protein
MTPFRMVTMMVLIFVFSLPLLLQIDYKPTGVNADPFPKHKNPEINDLCEQALEDVIGGHLDRAIATYTSAMQLDPKNPYVYIGRGDAYRNKDELDRAISDYDKAIRVDPYCSMARSRAEDARKQRALK